MFDHCSAHGSLCGTEVYHSLKKNNSFKKKIIFCFLQNKAFDKGPLAKIKQRYSWARWGKTYRGW